MNKVKKYLLENMFIKNYKRMWPYVKPFWFRALLTILLAAPVGAMDAVIAWSIKPFTDGMINNNPIFPAWFLPIIIVGFTTVQGALTYTVGYLNTWVGAKITNLLKADLFKKLLTFETDFFNKRNSGDVLVQFNTNADNACSGLLTNLKSFVQKFFTSVSLIFVLFYNSWQLALVCVTILVCAFVPMMTLKKKVQSVFSQSMNVVARLASK